jgi:hypothetical protein
MATADWAVHIPPQAIGSPSSGQFLPCVPLHQAREAIAIWLAIRASQPSASELQNGLDQPGPGVSYQAAAVRGTLVPLWGFPGVGNGGVTAPGGGPQSTAAGYLLASAMTRLPPQKVSQVLSAAWPRWLNWHTTDAQLAAALGIPMPSVAALIPPAPFAIPPGGPQNPLCTS